MNYSSSCDYFSIFPSQKFSEFSFLSVSDSFLFQTEKGLLPFFSCWNEEATA